MKTVKRIEVRINERQFKKLKTKEAFERYLTKHGMDMRFRITNITPPNKRYVILQQEVIVNESEEVKTQNQSDGRQERN